MTMMPDLSMSGGGRRSRSKGLAPILAGVTITLLAAGGAAARSHHHHHHGHKAPVATARDLQLAQCYGRFIAWRDELSALMQAAGAYTPSPEAPARFDRLEASFIDSTHKDMAITLHLRPTFAEADFPPDLRLAFQAGLKEAKDLYTADDYRDRQKAVLARTDLAPIPGMASLEEAADARFKPLGEPCDQLALANP
jgi:hypothetical protein